MLNFEKIFKDSDISLYEKGDVNFDDCGDGSVLMCATNTTAADFDEYSKTFEKTGYVNVSSRMIGDNRFNVFTKGSRYAYAYYAANINTAKIVTGPVEVLGDEDCGAFEEKYEPKLAMVGQTEYMNCGQGYIFLLPDGRILVQDGGGRYNDKKDFIYEAIKNIAPNPENMVIAAWFHSHPHSDHQDAYEEFIENHGSDKNVTVERVIVNYAPADMYTYKRRDGQYEDNKALVERIHEKTAKYIPNAKFIKPHTGQIFKFGSVDVEILFTVEDYLPVEQFDYVNSTSLVIRIICCGQSVLLLADTTHVSGRIMENIFGDYLRSDMVQLAHHGMWASNVSLYERVKARVVLWPNIDKVAKTWLEDKAIVASLENATDLYISGTGVKIIDFPYEFTNNKEQIIEAVKQL